MISKVENSIHVEAFELSPLNGPVITTKGRLRRSFPGPAISLSIETFEKPAFQVTMAHTLAKMSHQPAVETMPKARKAGQMHDEDRDTTHPHIVTELFMGFLRSVGEPVDVYRLWKNTREEVMWLDSRLPWRRSPMWLLLRVAMQLIFSRLSALSTLSGELYKTFMVFLMSRVLELSHQHAFPSDLMYAMNAKLARRLLKLDSSVNEPGLSFVQNVMRKTNQLIHARWSNIMKQAGPRYDLSNLAYLDFGQDVFNTLPALNKYINLMAKRENNKSYVAFQPGFALVKYQAEELPTPLDSSTTDYMAYNLRAFETWVALDLRQWLKVHKSNTSTCGKLDDLIQSYHCVAHLFYFGNPEATSMMLLTILELWIACDESATHVCELLKDYDPGIPQELLQSLALPFKCQMERLLHIENFLNRRRARARFRAVCIFQDFGLESCFSVRYFHQSPEHRKLLEKIESRATEARHEKCNELRRKKEEYESLMQHYDQSECEYYEVVTDPYSDSRETRHSSCCKKCDYQHRAASLDIRIHEWPLPKNALEAWSTVFELKVPPSYGHWRDTTVFLLLDVLGNEYSSTETPRASHTLQNYQGLSSSFTPFGSTQRIGLLSQNKPHSVTHRRDKSIAITTESDICLDNGLRYQYYDSITSSFVDVFRVTDDIPKLCTYMLPARSSSLQQFLFRPAAMASGLSPNTVIASQSECPDHMSFDEYKALSTIPLGYRIQWHNILLQLSLPSVDFKKTETGLVILHSIYQAGPSSNSNVLRASHEIVDNENFAHALLGSLHEALQRVKENWESSKALSTFISLATRLLSLTSKEQTKDKCLIYLASVRVVAFDWVNLLREKASKVTNDGERTDLVSRAVEIALICADSFNVDEGYLEDILALPEEASVLIQCSIVIQEGYHTISMTSDPTVLTLHLRWKWLSYRGYPILAKKILKTRGGCLNHAIKKSWSAYQAGDEWRAVSERVDNWFVSRTASQCNSDQLWVHFNLLTGELLVNGLPLARLPSAYERHPTYRTLFGHSALEVMPTAVSGMQFSGKKEYAGYTIHFGMNTVPDTLGSSEHDLLVQAMKSNRKSEIIPSRLLRGEFPVAFVNEFVHWYDITDNYLEFRPIEDPWTSSPHNWRAIRAKDGSKWRLVKGGISLVCVKSETAEVLSGILSPLEHPLQIHIIFHHSSSSLNIELPRLQLGFCLNLGASLIQSRQFRGMSIDTDQALGTLVGLRNKLMLKHENSGNRLVVLPEGTVSYEKNNDHIQVIIDKDSAAKAHAYYVDDQIGRLIDNGSLQSKLFLCNLHALTSFCLPDPLIQRTGTEQALSILDSAAVRSFERLAGENVRILGQIARLTPGRNYYPANERVMQTVSWSSGLSFLAQHGGFYKGVKSIFDQADKAKIFHPESYVRLPNLNHVDSKLLERDCIRSSTFRVSGFGAEDHTVEHDATYSARDGDQNSLRGSKAFIISSIIYHERTTLQYDVPSHFRDRLWEFLWQTHEIFGPQHPLPSSELKYDAGLLLNASEVVSKYWSTIHQILSRPHPRFEKFRLMIWLSTLAFANNSDMKIIQALASFFVLPEMAQILAPPISSFCLSQGATVNKPELRRVMRLALLPFDRCPEAKLSSHSWESTYVFNERRKYQFQSNQDRALNTVTNALEVQWPCETPATPIDVECSTYIDMGKAMIYTKPKFKTWWENYCFDEYLGQISDALWRRTVDSVEMASSSFAIPGWNLRRRRGFICIDVIMACSAPSVLPPRGNRKLNELLACSTGADNTTPRLTALIDRLEAQASSKYGKNYVENLRGSLHSLQDWGKEYYLPSKGDGAREILLANLRRCKRHVCETYETILSAVTDANEVGDSYSAQTYYPSAAAAAAAVKQWPRLSPIFFLQQLTRRRWQKITNDWKRCIVQYGLALTELQRAERLVSLSANHADLIKELQNRGHMNWDPLKYPESLLLEVESGILIRKVQEQIAGEMRDPQPGRNAVMQLNMGEGKSSVIVPIVAAALANGSQLVRVIVAKPQSKQMFQMLVSKLGGLLDRRVYHMPFSRALRLGETDPNAIGSICRECMTNGGILLVQPENILSFKLMGLECLISGNEITGRSLLSTQEFFDTSSRDIVDESDENFSVKFELIYTMGMQRPVELSPERWVCIQQVLDLVKVFASSMKKEFPLSIEVDERWPGSFPRTRILQPDAQHRMSSCIAKHICETGLNGFPIARQPEAVRQAVFRYITEPNLTADEIERFENRGTRGFWADTTSDILLLLRGVIAGGVLSFALGQKRWRVNYGLDATRQPRTKLAVPYRAKDNPTPRSEFGHPDIVIVLTSLSYYYGGLENDDMFLALGHLLKSDQADIEYQAWVKDAPGLPPAFRQLVGINLKDRCRCIEQVIPPLRYAKSAIDYFLSHIVFPKEMKEFPHKLSASGWDIGQIKTHPTTGFSGTNDSRKTLPLSVEHLDLQEQKHTNALVLEYLLQPENSVALLPPRGEASVSDAEFLLAMVTKMEPPTQVILDVGAQILELSNLGVAREWLKIMPDHDHKQAVVFFNDSDELSVLDRKGHIESLQTSSFAKQLDVCLVFLDEAHTRGTDLKLPEYYRAAVTLGPKLTKDRLVQGKSVNSL
jgi:Protein of unknown function (DUF3638)/Protein of unknown function (DUF3645)